ncbi:hypothetical protein ACX9R5_06640 [Rathayibacter sp. CAU 1779]
MVRVHAVRATWSRPVFCFESAAALHGLPLFGEPKYVHVLGGGTAGTHSTRRGLVAVHQLSDVREIIGTALGSAVGISDTVLDLARLLPPAFGLAVADAALHKVGGPLASDLLRSAHGQKWRYRMRRVDWVLGEADPAPESAGESVSRAVIAWLGYPRPELQQTFHYEGATDRPDFYWRDERVIGESDGYGKYDDTDAESSKARFVEEKKREDRLRRYEKGFIRWDMSDALRVTALEGKLRAGGLRPVTAPNAVALATLVHNPRSLRPATATYQMRRD